MNAPGVEFEVSETLSFIAIFPWERTMFLRSSVFFDFLITFDTLFKRNFLRKPERVTPQELLLGGKEDSTARLDVEPAHVWFVNTVERRPLADFALERSTPAINDGAESS